MIMVEEIKLKDAVPSVYGFSEEYIRAYNDALADIRWVYYIWNSHKLREKGDPVVLSRDVKLLEGACKKLKKHVDYEPEDF